MTSTNTQRADDMLNAAAALRSAADLLDINYTAGEVNIFGETETAESIADHIESNRFKAASIIKQVAAAISTPT